jgi:septal ring factor EnvC (AmiA/AmiB activator)
MKMMDKIKETLSAIWGWIALVAAAAVGIMLYIIQAKQKKINALNAKVELADTQKKADLVEVEIKEHLANNATLDKEVTELNKSLSALEQKRKDIAASEKNKTPDQVEDFWNKK